MENLAALKDQVKAQDSNENNHFWNSLDKIKITKKQFIIKIKINVYEAEIFRNLTKVLKYPQNEMRLVVYLAFILNIKFCIVLLLIIRMQKMNIWGNQVQV